MRIVLYFLLIFSSLPMTLAQNEPKFTLTCENSIENKPIQIGDPLECKIVSIDQNKNSNWKIISQSDEKWLTLGPIVIETTSLRPAGNTLLFSALAIQAGNLIVPSIHLQDTNGNTIQTIPLQLKIESVLNEKDKNPIWLLPPIPVGGLNLATLYFITAILLVLLFIFGYWIIRIFRRKKISIKPITSAYYIDKLSNIDLSIKNESTPDEIFYKNICFELSILVRSFYGFIKNKNVLDQTDTEFLKELSQQMDLKEAKELFQKIYQSTEEIKYNKKIILRDGLLEITGLYSRVFEIFHQKTNPIQVGQKGNL